MTKKLDPKVKETRRRYRAIAKGAKVIGVPPRLLLEVLEDLKDKLPAL